MAASGLKASACSKRGNDMRRAASTTAKVAARVTPNPSNVTQSLTGFGLLPDDLQRVRYGEQDAPQQAHPEQEIREDEFPRGVVEAGDRRPDLVAVGMPDLRGSEPVERGVQVDQPGALRLARGTQNSGAEQKQQQADGEIERIAAREAPPVSAKPAGRAPRPVCHRSSHPLKTGAVGVT